MSEEEQFNQAFGEHTRIPGDCRARINGIKNNDHDFIDLKMRSSDTEKFTDQAWRLLGRYIANNTHLGKVELHFCHLRDRDMVSLFSELSSSKSLERLDIGSNYFGIDGVRSLVPLLRNAANLSHLHLGTNTNRNMINNECFEMLISALHGSGSFKKLFFGGCNITNISALDMYTLPNLQKLILSGNNIGRQGCITLSNMLQQEGSNLSYLGLEYSGVGREEAELLASSLKHNTKLETLHLSRNEITERGYKAFVKLLVDASSIDNTYNSNHTLKCLPLYSSGQGVGVRTTELVESAIQINKSNNDSHAAGRSKVIKYQLSSKNRKEICDLQGIEYSSIGNLFSDIEPAFLPRILSLIGEKHGQSEFYTALIPMVPDLTSCVDTSSMMKDSIAQNSIRIAEFARLQAVFTAKNDQLSRRLAERESGDSRQSANTGSMAASEKKRQRS